MSDTMSSDGEVDFKPSLDVSHLPQVVQNRVKALKNIQLDTVKAECEYYKEVHELDLKYQKIYDEINKKRACVLSGDHEPSGAEIEWKEPSKDEDSDVDVVTNGVDKIDLGMDENTKGIPKFWMYTLKNANDEALLGMVEPHDEPVLEYLTDITVTLNQPKNNGFTLHFLFSENPYFTNTALDKMYKLREDLDPESPLEFDGPEIIDCTGCPIEWKEGKDVTKMLVKVKKLKSRKAAKCCPEKAAKCCPDKDITKEVKADSFFNFFSPPVIPNGKEMDMTDEDRSILARDFDVGFAIKEKIIPRAVLYFTGEAFDDDDDEFEDCDTEEEESDGDN